MKTKTLIATTALLLSLGAGAAHATEVPTTQCGDVVDGFEVGARADLCPDTSIPIPNIPPMTADDVVGSYPAPAPVIPQPAPVIPQPAPVIPQPEEDEPGWDCETMGNGVCGPEVAAEVPVPAEVPESVTGEPEALAYTGVNTFGLVMGAALLGTGIWVLSAGRRKA